MASTIKVDNVQNQPGTNVINKCGTTVTVGAGSDNIRSAGNNLQASDGGNLISQSGTTITLGASGDTVTLASGASQTGFGRTGTVDWQTGDIKTGTFTAVSGKGYFVNTTSGAVTGNLPSSPSAGDIVAFADYAGTAGSNKITIGRGGSNIEGSANDGEITQNRDSITLVYVDGTQGWLAVNDNESTFLAAKYVTATGGTITTSGDYKIHSFTGPGTFCVSCAGNPMGSTLVDYLVIAGGGGGGGSRSPGGGAGAGGAGGYRESPGSASGCYTVSPRGASPAVALPVSVQGYPITVGSSGPGAPSGSPANAGSGTPSVFSTITSAGGGFGGSPNSPQHPGEPGGSGGGGPWQGRPSNTGTGNTPSVSPPQGMPGGTGSGNPGYAGGGGGGALAAGSAASNCAGGAGGGGATSSINGTPTARAGGGGGGGGGGSGPGGAGPSGGGAGGAAPNGGGTNAPANLGGGGGAGAGGDFSGGGNGGTGLVILRYKYQN